MNAHLQSLLPSYVAEVVNAPEDGDDDALGDRDSDGEVIKIDTLLYQYFEFLGTIAGSPTGKKQFSGNYLGDLVKALLRYMMLTNEQVGDFLRGYLRSYC